MGPSSQRRVGSNSDIFRVRSQTEAAAGSAIAAIAAKQNGNVTVEQLHAIGLDDDAIAYRVKLGRLYRAHRGVYAVGHPPSMPLEHASAAVLACGPGAALSHGSAMVLWEFWKRWEFPLEVTVAGDRRPQRITV